MTVIARAVKSLAWRARESWRGRAAGSLLAHEARRWSQNGEDGILAEIFRRIGPGARTFVEFGVGDGTQCNTRALAEDGWSGTWFEACASSAARARELASGRSVNVVQAFLTAEDIAETLTTSHVSRDVDLMSIDVDGNDYHLWRAISGFSPRVVVIEYNASFEPGVHWVMPYEAAHRWDLTDHFGASLDAYAALGDDLGYALVGCESQGVNAFFVRKGDAGHFVRPGDVAYHYMSPKYCGLAFGHPSR